MKSRESLDRKKAPKFAAIIMLAGIAALSACSSNNSQDQESTSQTVSTSASPNITTEDNILSDVPTNMANDTTTEPKSDYITTMNISPEYLENAILSMDGYLTVDERDTQPFVDGIYAPYVPEAIGASGMCISKTEAQAEVDVRNAHIKLMENLKGSVPEDVYKYAASIYWNPKRLEDQSAALLANAAPDEECPLGSNTNPVTFEFNGEQHTTDAAHVLFLTKGAGAFRKNPGLYNQEILQGQADGFGQYKFESADDFTMYAIGQSEKITKEKMVELLRHYDLS